MMNPTASEIVNSTTWADMLAEMDASYYAEFKATPLYETSKLSDLRREVDTLVAVDAKLKAMTAAETPAP